MWVPNVKRMNPHTPRPRRAYPFTLDQVTGKNPPPPLSEEEERQGWEAVDAAGPDPDEDRLGWEGTLSSLYNDGMDQTYPARALHLQNNGDSPETLMEMCQMPQQLRLLRDPEEMDADEAEEHATLINEVAVYFAYWENRVMEHRNRYIVRLWALGWTQPQIASLLGLTKQRVHTILESQPPLEEEQFVRRTEFPEQEEDERLAAVEGE